jgi:predicted kinase
VDGQPTLFDGVEFNERISCIDVVYDVAFLVMDLWRRQLLQHANVVLNRYLSDTGDLEALALLPLFLSCRAGVRAMTSATAAHLQSDPARRRELLDLTAEYLGMADRLLRPPPPRLIAIGGLSGSGKSTIAQAVAPALGAAPGAMVFRSDEIRKRLAGRPRLDQLGPEGYTPEMSTRVYDRLLDDAGMTIRSGHTAIVDAVYAQPAERAAIEQAARDLSVPFVGCWLDAPEEARIARAESRRRDPSDADAAVIREQTKRHVGPIAWCRVDAARPAETVIAAVCRLLA